MAVTSFESIQPLLSKILEDIDCGKMQLPDFQRGWIWDDDHIRSLIASLSLSFPIGAVMTLATGGADVNFKPRRIEGVLPVDLEDPETLILDGQQRLTSLYQALMIGKPVETKDAKGKKIKRWYYLDMIKCLDARADRDEAVRSVPDDRQVKGLRNEILLDLSSPTQEYENEMFPMHMIFDAAEWRRGYSEHWNRTSNKAELWDRFEREIVDGFKRYQIPVIKLDKETSKEAVCLVFEKVNTGGVTLTVFELLTASFAAHNFDLREDWESRENRMKAMHPVLEGLQSDAFLQALTLLATKARPDGSTSCRRRDILRLTVGEYREWADQVEAGFIRSARFMHRQKVFKSRDLPYQTQLIPLAAILADLGDEGDTEGVYRKIARWYWCGVFGEIYSGPTETLFGRDLPEVIAWARGQSGEPATVRDANFQASRLLTLRTRNSAAYKGIHALLMRDGCCDFRTGDPVEYQDFFDDNIDIHHIFPRAWCEGNDIESTVFNSIVNKTPIGARTNRMIGGQAPSIYLPRLEKRAGVASGPMNEILDSHCISAERLRNDDFWGFFEERGEALLRRIGKAMGDAKRVVLDEGVFTPSAAVEDYDDGPTDWSERAAQN